MFRGLGDPALQEPSASGAPTWILEIVVADIWGALGAGAADLRAMAGPSLVLGGVQAAVGLTLTAFTLQQGLAVLVVPLIIGLAILGPVVSVGFFELSRRREAGLDAAWWSALVPRRVGSLGGVVSLGLMLAALFFAWMGLALLLARLTIVPMPIDLASLAATLLTTPEGLVLLTLADLAALLFAAAAFAMSVMAFPLLVDRDIDTVTAVLTSVRAVATNPWPMALWAVIVAAAFAFAALTAFIAFVVISPLLGHTTWHLYRRVMSD